MTGIRARRDREARCSPDFHLLLTFSRLTARRDAGGRARNVWNFQRIRARKAEFAGRQQPGPRVDKKGTREGEKVTKDKERGIEVGSSYAGGTKVSLRPRLVTAKEAV